MLAGQMDIKPLEKPRHNSTRQSQLIYDRVGICQVAFSGGVMSRWGFPVGFSG